MGPGIGEEDVFYDRLYQYGLVWQMPAAVLPPREHPVTYENGNRLPLTAFTESGGMSTVPAVQSARDRHVGNYNAVNAMAFTKGYQFPRNTPASLAMNGLAFDEANRDIPGDFGTNTGPILGNMYPNIHEFPHEYGPAFDLNALLHHQSTTPQGIHTYSTSEYWLPAQPEGGYENDKFAFGKNVDANFTFEFENPSSVTGSPNPFTGKFPTNGIKKSQCEFLKPLGPDLHPYNFECTNCASRFHSAGDAKKHAIRQLRLMVCKYSPQCDKSFGRKNLWENHMKNCKFGKKVGQTRSSPHEGFFPLQSVYGSPVTGAEPF